MKAILHQSLAGKLAGVIFFLLSGSAMAHPGHGGIGILHHLPGNFEVLLAVAAGCLAYHIGSRNSRA